MMNNKQLSSSSSSSNINTHFNIYDKNMNNIPISEKALASYWCYDEGALIIGSKISNPIHTISCPSCGHHLHLHDEQLHQGGASSGGFNSLPAGVKFDPTDTQVLVHLENKINSDLGKLHPLLHQFIPTIEGQNGICYTHPQKLPGVSKNGVMRHFFHRPSKAYTTGTRKRRKVDTDEDVGETRWHKTGKTRPISVNGEVKGFKKILVLYTNYGRQRKAEKTNWVMHQYHIGENEEERDGEYVVSKVFYQTQPRQSASNIKDPIEEVGLITSSNPVKVYQQQPHYICYNESSISRGEIMEATHLIPNFGLQADASSSSIQLAGLTK